MLKRILAVLLAVALAAPASAQNNVVSFRAYDSAIVINPGDSTNNALRVNVVAGSFSVTTAPTYVTTANNDGAQATLTVASSTILASFPTRKFAAICALAANTDLVYIKLAASAATTDFAMSPGTCFNIPTFSVYTGIIDGRSASGSQVVTFVEY